MRWAVFAHTNRVVGKHVDDGNFHDGRQPHGGARVVAEDQEAGAKWTYLAEGHAIQDGAHGVFANSEMEVSSGILAGFEITCTLKGQTSLGRRSQVGCTTDQPGDIFGKSIHHLGR